MLFFMNTGKAFIVHTLNANTVITTNFNNLKPGGTNMDGLNCTKCGEASTTTEELITGICKYCGGSLEEEDEFELDNSRGTDREV